jgi:hypothetical protein
LRADAFGARAENKLQFSRLQTPRCGHSGKEFRERVACLLKAKAPH